MQGQRRRPAICSGGEAGDDDGLQHQPDGAEAGERADAGDGGDDAAGGPQQVGDDDRLDGGGADRARVADEPDGGGVDQQEDADAAEQAGGQAEQVVEQRGASEVGGAVGAGDDGVEPEGEAEQQPERVSGEASGRWCVVMPTTVAPPGGAVDYLRGKRQPARPSLASRRDAPSRPGPPWATLLRDWRQRRRLSQLDLASEAGVSARHLSFVETGRARPSREMVLHLAEQLEIPLRERNELLSAAGFAPVYRTAAASTTPTWPPSATALDLVLAAYEPYPAVVVDRGWHLVAGNRGVALLTAAWRPTCSSRRSTCCG